MFRRSASSSNAIPARVVAIVCLGLWSCSVAQGAVADVERSRQRGALRFDYVGYRPARWEQEKVFEPQNERPNRGGLIHVYFTNTSERPVGLRHWRLNGKHDSYYRLGGYLAWDRLLTSTIPPGGMGVLEINGVSDDFAPGKLFRLGYIDRSWRPAGSVSTKLTEDPIQISYIRVLPGMDEIEVHVRNKSDEIVALESVEIVGVETQDVSWVSRKLDGPSHSIARVKLKEAVSPSALLIVKLTVTSDGVERTIYAHRRAFEDWFPIGTWSSQPDRLAVLRHHHIETIVKGGRGDDEFYSKEAARYGFRTMVPSGSYPDVDMIRNLGDHPAVACWMITDEPDWSQTPAHILVADEITRRYNSTKPTFVTLCRNVKFFEYASIVDIPCMDHYCVTAPTSSKWPKRYGTRLEETAYYTRDLKAASEPKPIWIWTQGIASWEERPKRPVPTPHELAAQLLLNVGRGAKGILWFNFELDVGEKYPDTMEAIRRWGRVLRLVRDDLLAAEPVEANVRASDTIDVAPLASWDKLILAVTNLDYEIHDTAYPWTTAKDVKISLDLPKWVRPATALAIEPDGITKVAYEVNGRRIKLALGDLHVCRLIVLANDANAEQVYKKRYQQVLEDERREF